MKKAIVVLMVLVFFLSLSAGLFAQESAYDVEGWKKESPRRPMAS